MKTWLTLMFLALAFYTAGLIFAFNGREVLGALLIAAEMVCGIGAIIAGGRI